jgi:hypothetical protein
MANWNEIKTEYITTDTSYRELSQKYGVRGFEIGFSAMGIMLLVPVLALLISFFITFRKDRVIEG